MLADLQWQAPTHSPYKTATVDDLPTEILSCFCFHATGGFHQQSTAPSITDFMELVQRLNLNPLPGRVSHHDQCRLLACELDRRSQHGPTPDTHLWPPCHPGGPAQHHLPDKQHLAACTILPLSAVSLLPPAVGRLPLHGAALAQVRATLNCQRAIPYCAGSQGAHATPVCGREERFSHMTTITA